MYAATAWWIVQTCVESFWHGQYSRERFLVVILWSWAFTLACIHTNQFVSNLVWFQTLLNSIVRLQLEWSWASLKVKQIQKSLNLWNYSVILIEWHEATKNLCNSIREMAYKKTCRYGKYRSFALLLLACMWLEFSMSTCSTNWWCFKHIKLMSNVTQLPPTSFSL